ncbi:tetratricopeptide repeat protein [Commensalibacter papalotli (ex Botero et al. 2024)]|uniref:Sel1 repeat family protein n=1 Tax=Commensalibacter papalotli (ex Botero et al. 2024) TaxID=2972766 RepID=A0ABM9HL01_9PROT|nr:tetratricopeptide repeat protein [Commensalibacter papalotli (ex Botero et al. 2024)]CAI3931067.1 unnamed protein product [Commensalibacter papalotli (ex Botero et al. 2024)]CAI3947612.1 unnamed protein product [Commensalibacter papalotli (ex Botero et al. 2024)]
MGNQGDAKVQYEWGILLVDGNKVKQDTITGRKWIEKAAKQGYTDAQTNIGSMYYFGIKPMTQDYNQAKTWFEKAAAQENMTAKNYLADISCFGQGVPMDTNKAKSLYKTLRDEGQETACNTYKDIEQNRK